MPTTLNRASVKQHLDSVDLRALFINELGWDHGGEDLSFTVGEQTFSLKAVAHKRGMVAYHYLAQPDVDFPDRAARQKIERAVAKQVREHIIVFCPHEHGTQHWQWVKREPGRPDRLRTHIYRADQSGEPLIQKLEAIVFTLEEEEDLSLVDVTGRVRAAFDVEKVTKRFYDRFKKEHQAFLGFIEGINNIADREWYASLMLNRMMFIYFIQKRGFLDGNSDYLRDRLHEVRQQHGTGRFASFYRLFLLKLFHEGLGQPQDERDPELVALLGQIPYLNGGLFDVHDLERDHPNIDIPDEAFEKIFAFFDAYQWHLDDRPLRNDNEINPDVLGYIFEKYINQEQMGAYYTKEDITGYISRNTIIPFLFDRAQKGCPIAFTPGGGVWRLLKEDPDGYFYEAVRHGITYDIHNNKELDFKLELPPDITAGLDDVAQRGGWNEPAPKAYALPTETWREHVARRRRYEGLYAKLAAGEVTSINDLITYNLNIEKFALDVIATSEGPELVRAFWKALTTVSVLDPTCGSGAFLFAALNILEPIYTACLEAMEGFLDDLARSQRPRSPHALSDFRKVLAHVDAHASPSYFILKSIIVGNLYGVDIMEEAVEICKLRLFLKLVAQLETYDQIEPLPDIDFNVRAGNTLVGFTTLQEIKDASTSTTVGHGTNTLAEQSRMLYGEDKAKLERVEEDAEIADRAFIKFREMQIRHGMDATDFAGAKLELRERLDALRAELDGYLAGKYGVNEGDEAAYTHWRASHRPFHWFVEFYGIMTAGGFDVIVGNPPYVEYKNVKKDYEVQGISTLACGDLYAFVFERSLFLSNKGRLGLIVPVSILSTDGFFDLRSLLFTSSRHLFFQAFSERPSKLFTGVEKRLCITILGKPNDGPQLYLSNYRRWNSKERSSLLHTSKYVSSNSYGVVSREAKAASLIPKVTTREELGIIDVLSKERPLGSCFERKSEFPVFYTRKARYFVQFLDFVPEIRDGSGNQLAPTELKKIFLDSSERRDAVLAALNSGLFFWFFSAYSDVRNLNRREIEQFPCSLKEFQKNTVSELALLGRKLTKDLKANSIYTINKYKKYGTRTIQTFQPRLSKTIVDQIDRVLAEHYGFTDEELDFIINYDIKYRMGL